MKKVINTILLFILVLVLGAGSYCGYIIFSYKRIGDVSLDVEGNAAKNVLSLDETYNMATYNIGFGAYSQDYTFFLDTGYDINEEETCGYYSTARSKEEVNFNVNGAINTVKSLDLDFVLLQEVDVKSTRSYKINQNDMFKESLSEYDNVFAINFDTAYLPYPLYDMHGKSLAGLSTFSRYKIKSANRYEYTISDNLSKLFDIDRCFSVSNVEVENGKTLYVINSHMSAYDKGGVIRQTQLKELNDFISNCLSEGNYVIVGGDFNHDLLTNNPDFNYDNKLRNPDWLSAYFNENKESPLVDGFRVVASDNVPTCRNNDIEWNPSLTFKCVVDGFVVSNNIEIITHYNVETKDGKLGLDGFSYSDHEPAYIEFKLL